MVWELFLIGSFWFWAVIFVETFWLLRCLHEESGWGIGLSLFGLGILLWLFGDFNIFTWAWYNPIWLLECAVGYLVIGTIWSLTRWKMLCVDVRDQLNEVKEEFRLKHEISGAIIPDKLRSDWRDYLSNQCWEQWEQFGRYRNSIRSKSVAKLGYIEATRQYIDRLQRNVAATESKSSMEDIIPQPREFKARILYWLGYWPLSMLWFFFHDIIERVFNRIYKTFSRLYQSIARGTFAGIPDDLGGDGDSSV